MRSAVVAVVVLAFLASTVSAKVTTTTQPERSWLLDASVVSQGNSSAIEGESPNGWVLYKQCGESWSNNHIGTSSNTICQVGCAMSSVAMALKTLGTNVDPGTLNRWLVSNGGFVSGDLLVWGSVAKFGTMSLYNYYHGAGSMDQASLQTTIGRHWPVIANVRNGGHWVLVTGSLGNGNYAVNDPGFSVSSYSYSDMSNFVVYSTR